MNKVLYRMSGAPFLVETPPGEVPVILEGVDVRVSLRGAEVIISLRAIKPASGDLWAGLKERVAAEPMPTWDGV